VGERERTKTKAKGETPNNIILQLGETNIKLTINPKGEITMVNHAKAEKIIFEPISLVYYVVKMAITLIISPKSLITNE
jgi:hypothetical protein